MFQFRRHAMIGECGIALQLGLCPASPLPPPQLANWANILQKTLNGSDLDCVMKEQVLLFVTNL